MAKNQNGYLRKCLYPCSKPFTTFSKILELIEARTARSKQDDIARLSDIRGLDDCRAQMLCLCDCKTLRAQPEVGHRFLNLFRSFTEQHQVIDAFANKLQQLIPRKILIAPTQ